MRHVVMVALHGSAESPGPTRSSSRRCLNRGMTRGVRVLAVLVGAAMLSTVVSMGPGPAWATHDGNQGGGVADSDAHPGAIRAQITFLKKPAHPWNSRITWQVKRQRVDGSWKVVAAKSWRAGSGLPGGSATNPCVKNHGWLPNGRYSLRQYNDYAGNLIHGRAFRLSDKRCPNGTLRQELFIHTEAAAGNTQCANGPGDQICRWEYPKINDYTSHGCIKMAPPGILALTRAYHRFFKAGVRYPMSRVSLLVR
jgi:hypothetical protein